MQKSESVTTSYMQMIYIDSDGNARQTGVCAAMDTDAKTKKAFESLRHLSVEFDKASFLCDLHDKNGDLVDTLAIRKEDFESITGEKIKSDSYYRRYDAKYWSDARREHAKAA